MYNGNTKSWLFHLKLACPVRGAVLQVSQHVYQIQRVRRLAREYLKTGMGGVVALGDRTRRDGAGRRGLGAYVQPIIRVQPSSPTALQPLSHGAKRAELFPN